MATIVVVLDFFPLLHERDRMFSQKQAKGSETKKNQGVWIRKMASENSR